MAKKFCEACLKSVTLKRNPGISCCNCSKYYHINCVGLTIETAEDIQKNSLSWSCTKCKSKSRKSQIFPLPSAIDTPDCEPSTSSATHPSLESKIKDLFQAFSDYKKATDLRIEHLECELKAKDNILSSVQSTVDHCSLHLDQVSQSLLGNNLEIQGLPLEALENPAETAVEISKSIGCDLPRQDIDFEPISGSSRPRLLLRFHSKILRDSFLKAGKRFNRNKSKFSYKAKNYKIHINEQLTPQQKLLLYDTKALSKEKGYKFAWICNGKIHLKKDENTLPIIIPTKQKLLSVLNDEDVNILPERPRSPIQDEPLS
jgi:PHD-finger